ncbi:MFS general substrate transporter [Trichodelitschia bisporula]|uniref:MFS general substrate transporter n=1 Tax=Trichodelitschia bisporula TaxID=703511 RepID=A0A6G1HQM9_9PEZI|nr:MFS general substrate transporter [Trichodelitschia bisporula]
MTSTLLRPLTWFTTTTGLSTVLASPRDVHLILATRSLRMFAYGATSLIFALYLRSLSIPDPQMGAFMTFTLLGDIALSLLLTFTADTLGRRRTLALGAAGMLLAGSTFALAQNYWVLLGAAVVGVISPAGSEIGPFRAVEESTLAHVVPPDQRPFVLAWYVVTAALGSAAGVAGGGALVDGLMARGWAAGEAYAGVFWIVALVGSVNILLAGAMSAGCEQRAAEYEGVPLVDSEGDSDADAEDAKPAPLPPPKKAAFTRISRSSRAVLFKLCLLFALDSIGSGMANNAFVNYYLTLKFGVRASVLGGIMSSTWIVSAASNMFAGTLAARLGLLKTMVYTHLPSSLMLAALPVPGSLAGAAVLLVLRAGLSSMDQAPRSAFIAGAVRAEEMTAVMGVVNVARTLMQSVGPGVTGLLAGRGLFALAFVGAGALKAGPRKGYIAMQADTADPQLNTLLYDDRSREI